ncbi:MAG TPA: hypothetical protein DCY88_26370 [Cyanobacteria bacterium UBA11372]|nr:hypothetical protein [Cyanobacteria bacterium UBA11372]HBE53495.1 hypothetical protein [Cyanobacteria bacterium UBA11369]
MENCNIFSVATLLLAACGVARFLAFLRKTENSGENIMAEEFRADSFGSDSSNSEPSEPEREAVRILIISSNAGIRETINTLYQKDFAQVDDWTPVQPAVNYPGELVTILVRYRIRQEGDSLQG